MVKAKILVVRISAEQEILLSKRALASGFSKKSEYVRCLLFKPELIKGDRDA